MKLLLDLQGCQSTGSRQRGIGRYSLALAQAMVRQATHHECWLLLNGAFRDTLAPLAAAFEGLLPAGRIAIFQPPRDCAEAAREGRWRTLAAERVRQHAIRALAPDVLHVNSLFEGYLDDCATSVDAQDVPTAVTLYDLIPLQHPQRYLADPRTRAWYERKLAALGRAPLLLGISQATCEEARSALPPGSRAIVNISSAGNPCFRPDGPRGTAAPRLGLVRPFVMYTGGIDWRKNIEGLVAAWARLPSQVRATHQLALVCHAQDHARSAVLGAARAAGLAPDELVLTGWVSDDDLADLYRSCALFVFPSLHEGFGLPALEAMMCGAPVIGSNTSSIPEVIGRADALFDPHDLNDIADRMLRGLQDESFRDALRTNADEQSARFSWDRCAQDALQALEGLHAASPRKPTGLVPVPPRPRLALLTPLPPLESGIAEYSMALAAALQPHYEIELVNDQAEVTLPPALAKLPVRSMAWFRAHAGAFDRVLYQFGNSVLHAPMFELLREVPGVVVLHDFFLSGVQNWMEELGLQPGALASALFRSHGAAAVDYLRAHGRDAAVLRYPANRFVLERATGVIVHSGQALAAADEWYGAGTARHWRRIGQMRALPATISRARARAALSLAEDDFLVCAFGHLGPTKLNLELLQAWAASALNSDPHCRLALVGRNTRPPYGDQVTSAVAALGARVTVTGFADDALYEHYLSAADLAVQLRAGSRGETSRAVLDALAYGVPLLLNAHGTNTEYPAEVAFSVRDDFDVAELARALESLRQDGAERARFRAAGPSWIAKHHDPQRIAAQMRDAIEHFAARPQRQAYWSLMASIGELGASDDPDDLVEAAVAIAAMDWNGDLVSCPAHT